MGGDPRPVRLLLGDGDLSYQRVEWEAPPQFSRDLVLQPVHVGSRRGRGDCQMWDWVGHRAAVRRGLGKGVRESLDQFPQGRVRLRPQIERSVRWEPLDGAKRQAEGSIPASASRTATMSRGVSGAGRQGPSNVMCGGTARMAAGSDGSRQCASAGANWGNAIPIAELRSCAVFDMVASLAFIRVCHLRHAGGERFDRAARNPLLRRNPVPVSAPDAATERIPPHISVMPPC